MKLLSDRKDDDDVPLVKGGQGRSDDSIISDALWIMMAVGIGLLTFILSCCKRDK